MILPHPVSGSAERKDEKRARHKDEIRRRFQQREWRLFCCLFGQQEGKMLMAREKMLVCDVADAVEKIPVGARCVSLKFSRDPAIKIGTTKDVLAQICSNVFSRRNISARLRDAVRSVNPGWLNVNTTRMKRPCRVSVDYFVDLAGDDKAHFSRAARVLEWCGCSGTYARITYEMPEDERAQDDVVIDEMPQAMARIAAVLEADFPNGMRPSSIIDQNKMRRFYQERFNDELPEDFDFEGAMPRIGVTLQGKVFPSPKSDDQSGWGSLMSRLVAEGNRIFRFSTVMKRHGAELMAGGIVSAEMLHEVASNAADCAYAIAEDFFAPVGCPTDPSLAIEDAISKCDDGIVKVDEVAQALPYLEEEDILSYLKATPIYCWNTLDSYANISAVEFDGPEVERGKELCRLQIEKDGYFSLSQLDLPNSAALNSPRLQSGTLRHVFFKRFLSGDYKLHGQIVGRTGDEVDGCAPILAFCKDFSEVTMKQIEEIAKASNIRMPWAIRAVQVQGCKVRVDRDRFVDMDLIEWDRDGIEAAIDRMCVSNVLPLGMVRDFSEFPAVPGFPWNPYLLHDYVEHESSRDDEKGGKFTMHGVSYASKTVAGLITRKGTDEEQNRDLAFARAAADAGIEPAADAVGDFLIEQRCILRRSMDLQIRVAAEMMKLEGGK